MQIAVIHYMMKQTVRTKRRRSEFSFRRERLRFLFDVDICGGGFVLFFLFMDTAHPAAGTASAVPAGAGHAALVLDKMADGEKENAHDDRADEDGAEIVLYKSKHENHLLILFHPSFGDKDWDVQRDKRVRRAIRTRSLWQM